MHVSGVLTLLAGLVVWWTTGIGRGNLDFTAAFNLMGLSIAAFGFLLPVLAAAL